MAYSVLRDAVHAGVKSWGKKQRLDDAQVAALMQKTLSASDYAKIDTTDVSTMTPREADAVASNYVRRIADDPRTDLMKRR